MESNENLQFLIPKNESNVFILPVEVPEYTHPINFVLPAMNQEDVLRFNLDPLKNYEILISRLGTNPSLESIARLMFFLDTISPHSISYLFFYSNFFISNNFISYFFMAPVLTFMPLIDSVRILSSRLAIPYSRSKFISYVNSMADSIVQNNCIEGFNTSSISHLIICFIYHSISVASQRHAPLTNFLDVCNICEELRKMGIIQMTYFYEKLCEEPISFIFSFTDPRYKPNSDQFGSLLIKSGSKKGWKLKNFQIENGFLKKSAPVSYSRTSLYKSSSKSSVKTASKSSSAKNKTDILIKLEDVSFVTPSEKGNELSFAIFGQQNAKCGNESFITKSKEEVEQWRSSIMLCSFCQMIEEIIHQR